MKRTPKATVAVQSQNILKKGSIIVLYCVDTYVSRHLRHLLERVLIANLLLKYAY